MVFSVAAQEAVPAYLLEKRFPVAAHEAAQASFL
jgi:hypothetical protein